MMGDFSDLYDWGDEDDYGEGYATYTTCKRCHTTDLFWQNLGTDLRPEWRLFENKGLRLVAHVCPPQDHSNAFEDES